MVEEFLSCSWTQSREATILGIKMADPAYNIFEFMHKTLINLP
jgi:hypothetical protein